MPEAGSLTGRDEEELRVRPTWSGKRSEWQAAGIAAYNLS